MKKRIFWICLCTLLSFSLAACGEKMKSYENPFYGVSIRYPQDWIPQEGVMGTVVTFVHVPKRKERKPYAFKENINIVVQELPEGEKTLSEYSDLVLEQLKMVMPDAEILKSEKVKFFKNRGHRIFCKVSQDNVQLKWLQTWTIENGKAYMVTYTAEESRFKRFLPRVEKMLETLEVF